MGAIDRESPIPMTRTRSWGFDEPTESSLNRGFSADNFRPVAGGAYSPRNAGGGSSRMSRGLSSRREMNRVGSLFSIR
jgi:hypothetical protein